MGYIHMKKLIVVLLLCCSCMSAQKVSLVQADSTQVVSEQCCAERDRRVTFVLLGWGIMVMVIAWDNNNRD